MNYSRVSSWTLACYCFSLVWLIYGRNECMTVRVMIRFCWLSKFLVSVIRRKLTLLLALHLEMRYLQIWIDISYQQNHFQNLAWFFLSTSHVIYKLSRVWRKEQTSMARQVNPLTKKMETINLLIRTGGGNQRLYVSYLSGTLFESS